MLHGKKAFDRLLYACKNVFPTPLTWLYSYTEGNCISLPQSPSYSISRFSLVCSNVKMLYKPHPRTPSRTCTP